LIKAKESYEVVRFSHKKFFRTEAEVVKAADDELSECIRELDKITDALISPCPARIRGIRKAITDFTNAKAGYHRLVNRDDADSDFARIKAQEQLNAAPVAFPIMLNNYLRALAQIDAGNRKVYKEFSKPANT
jgi:hypothetical protein